MKCKVNKKFLNHIEKNIIVITLKMKSTEEFLKKYFRNFSK